MGWSDKDFDLGLVMAHAYCVAEKDRQQEARAKVKELSLKRTPENEAAFQRALDECAPSAPMWQLISGISPRNELTLDPAHRRSGIRRLMRVVERMFRADIETPDEDGEGQLALDNGMPSFSRRSALWDPLPEICMYLGISKSKLNALCVQRTGIRATDVCDCIRLDKLRGVLRDKFRPLLREWAEQMKELGKAPAVEDTRNAAWRFLKWIRGGGRCETRKKFAYALGMTSRERLDRACLLREGETIEGVEVEVAMGVLKEWMEGTVEEPAVVGEMSAHGAGCDEVGRIDDLRSTIDDLGRQEAARAG